MSALVMLQRGPKGRMLSREFHFTDIPPLSRDQGVGFMYTVEWTAAQVLRERYARSPRL